MRPTGPVRQVIDPLSAKKLTAIKQRFNDFTKASRSLDAELTNHVPSAQYGLEKVLQGHVNLDGLDSALKESSTLTGALRAAEAAIELANSKLADLAQSLESIEYRLTPKP